MKLFFNIGKGGRTFKYLILYYDISLGIFTYQKTDDGVYYYPLPKLLCNVDGLPFRLGCCLYMQIAPLFIYSAV